MSDNLPTSEQLYELTQQATVELAESLSECLQTSYSLEANAPFSWRSDSEVAQRLAQPGLVLIYQFNRGDGFLVAIPENLPLPGWYKTPDETEQARLQNLAVEWQFRIFPEEAIDVQASASPSNNLANAIEWSTPLETAQVIELSIRQAGAESDTGDAESGAKIWLIGPVEAVPVEISSEDEYKQVNEPELQKMKDVTNQERFAPELTESPHYSAVQLAVDPQELIARTRRLMRLNVKVSVRLAEMKIPLNTLVNLCPGTLLVFPKSCDDLLDLYVNNQLYAQGEAVKIGEKFGLKVNQVGVKKQRPVGVFSL